MQTTADRIKERMRLLKVSQADIKRATGAGKATISSWVKGDTNPSGNYASKLAKFLKCRTDWLLTGDGSSEIATVKKTSNNLPPNIVIIGKHSEYPPIKVKYIDIKASCGAGYSNEDYPSTHSEYLSVEFLRENDLPIDGKGVIVMHACNDSMGYTIPNGSLIIVNTNDREFDNFVNNKIYVFRVDGEMICKRAVKRLDGTVILKSDNTDKETYPDQEITRETFNQFELFGRVHWVSNKV